MIDLHTHSLLSDGEVLPFELARRAAAAGYSAIAITDHIDLSTMEATIEGLVRAVDGLAGLSPIQVIAGAEITHAPPAIISALVRRVRELGARIVVVHGETITEPVEPGTNKAGIEAGADILAHPGLITEEDVLLAREMDVALEITARKGHSITNGHVARLALRYGARLVLNTDAHAPSDLITKKTAVKVLMGAGIEYGLVEAVFNTSRAIVEKALRRSDA